MERFWNYSLPLDKAEKLFKYTIANSTNARVRHTFGNNYSIVVFLNYTEADFLAIPNIGKDAYAEIRQIQENLLQYVTNNTDWCDPDNEVSIIASKYDISSLSDIKKRLVLYKFKEFIKNSKNARICHTYENASIHDVERFLNYSEYDFLNIPNIGKGTLSNLLDVQEKTARYLDYVGKMLDADCFVEEISFVYGINDGFMKSFYEKNKYVPMFWIMEQYYKKKIEEREWDIFVSRYKITKSYAQKTLEDLAKKHGLTRERVRQLEKYFPKDCYDFPCRQTDWVWYIETLMEKNKFTTNTALSSILNKENCNFSTDFALELLYWVSKGKYMYIGGLVEENDNSKWNKKLLIEKEITEAYDFEKFYRTCKDFSEKNDLECTKDIKALVQDSRFVRKDVSGKNEFISNVLKYILQHALGLSIVGSTVLFPAVKERKLYKYISDILQETQKPMHITEISNRLKEMLPGKHYEESQIRSCIQNYDEFSYQSRNSTYILREWDKIFSGTKGDAIEKFLEEKDVPQTIDDIKQYVDSCFPNSQSARNSVNTLMMLDAKKRFVRFENHLYGLNKKTYPVEYVPFVGAARQLNTFDERLQALKTFLNENGILPSYSSDNREEISLRRWWYNQVRLYSELTEERKMEIDQFRSEFNID